MIQWGQDVVVDQPYTCITWFGPFQAALNLHHNDTAQHILIRPGIYIGDTCAETSCYSV